MRQVPEGIHNGRYPLPLQVYSFAQLPRHQCCPVPVNAQYAKNSFNSIGILSNAQCCPSRDALMVSDCAFVLKSVDTSLLGIRLNLPKMYNGNYEDC